MDANEGRFTDDQWGELLAEAQRGNSVAYRQFLRSILPFARSIARRYAAIDDVEDIVQESLLTVHRVRHTYEPGRPVKPWLAAIVRRRSIDFLRGRGRLLTREVHNRAAYETYADPAANNTETYGGARELARMMRVLPPRQKEALDMVKLGDMSLAEASAATGQSATSLKVNVHRAIKRLRTELKEGSANDPRDH